MSAHDPKRTCGDWRGTCYSGKGLRRGPL